MWFGAGDSRQQVFLKGLPSLMGLKGLRYTLNGEQVHKDNAQGGVKPASTHMRAQILLCGPICSSGGAS